MSDKEDSTHEKSDDVEDLNEDEKKKLNDESSAHNAEKKSVDQKVVTNELKEKVISYVKIDDLIRKKNEEIRELKSKRKPCEDYIIKFLEKQEAGFVSVAGGKLIKNESETKAPLKVEFIKEAIKEGIETKKLVDSTDNEKTTKLAEEIMELMEKKRPLQKRTNLKRTFAGEARKKAEPKKTKIKKSVAK